MLAPETWTVVLVALAIGSAGWKFRKEIAEALQSFRGGPPAGMHPSPGDDSVLLLRRRRRPNS